MTLESRLLYRVKRNDIDKIIAWRVSLSNWSWNWIPIVAAAQRCFLKAGPQQWKYDWFRRSNEFLLFFPLWLDYSACLTQVWFNLHGLLAYPASSGSKAKRIELRESRCFFSLVWDRFLQSAKTSGKSEKEKALRDGDSSGKKEWLSKWVDHTHLLETEKGTRLTISKVKYTSLERVKSGDNGKREDFELTMRSVRWPTRPFSLLGKWRGQVWNSFGKILPKVGIDPRHRDSESLN